MLSKYNDIMYIKLLNLRKYDKKNRVVKVIQILSDIIKTFTESTPHTTTLQLIINEDNEGVECILGADDVQKRIPTLVFLADYHVRLQTIDGCDYAVLGLSTIENSPHNCELVTETLSSQQRKGYNTFMRAIAIVIGFVDEKILYSYIENPISAMIQLRSYICDVCFDSTKNQYLSYSSILTENQVQSIYKDVKIIRLDPNINIRTSINIIISWLYTNMKR